MRARDEEKANTLYNKNNSIKEMIPHEKKTNRGQEAAAGRMRMRSLNRHRCY